MEWHIGKVIAVLKLGLYQSIRCRKSSYVYYSVVFDVLATTRSDVFGMNDDTWETCVGDTV